MAAAIPDRLTSRPELIEVMEEMLEKVKAASSMSHH